jgi:hypothetical protein
MLTTPHTLCVCLCRVQTGNAVEFVKLLLDMRDKYETTITQAFSDDKNFKNTLNSVSGVRGGGAASLPAGARSPSSVSVSPPATCTSPFNPPLTYALPPSLPPLPAPPAAACCLCISVSVSPNPTPHPRHNTSRLRSL